MIAVWRIGFYPTPAPSPRKLLRELGYGATLSDGRWHKANKEYLVYAAQSRALCHLEKRVHCNGVQPVNLALLKLELPAKATFEQAQDRGLRPDWREHMHHTQQLGMQWRQEGKSLGLWVPSFVVDNEFNLLINPDHDDYDQIKITVEAAPFVFDSRLF